MNTINIKEYLQNLLQTNNIEYTDLDDVLKDFIKFMEHNYWFNIKLHYVVSSAVTELHLDNKNIEVLETKILSFYKYKDQSIDIKIQLLGNQLKYKFPISYNDLELFCETFELSSKNIYIIYDFVLWTLKKELRLYKNEDMNDYIGIICDELPKSIGNILIQFFLWLKDNFKVNYTNAFTLNQRVFKSSNGAYDSELYLKLIYYLFNPNYIENNCFYNLAVDNKNTIDTWLYLSLHCICALRDTDLYRLPHPRLSNKPEIVLEKISNGTFYETDALIVINSVLWRLKNLPLVPSKTSKTTGISNIKLFVPESAKVHFGILFAIAEAHYQLSNKDIQAPLIRKIADYSSICKYLNEEIGDLFLIRNFSSISANKAYMQSIESLSDTLLDDNLKFPHAKGYMLAALARSHKSSFGEFAKTTEIYLKDANFSGYSSEFIAKELFERGVCSFIPSMLLKIVTCGDYNKLSIPKQTQLINILGMDAYNVEKFVTTISTSITQAQEILTQILNQTEINKDNIILDILHRIGSGDAISKTEDCLCIMTAMGKICPFSESRQCIGCKYEISTKSTIYALVREFQRLLKLRSETTNEHMKNKYTMLMKEIIAPKIEEILICAKENYGEEFLSELEYIIKEATFE